jgi:hypothetical protein
MATKAATTTVRRTVHKRRIRVPKRGQFNIYGDRNALNIRIPAALMQRSDTPNKHTQRIANVKDVTTALQHYDLISKHATIPELTIHDYTVALDTVDATLKKMGSPEFREWGDVETLVATQPYSSPEIGFFDLTKVFLFRNDPERMRFLFAVIHALNLLGFRSYRDAAGIYAWNYFEDPESISHFVGDKEDDESDEDYAKRCDGFVKSLERDDLRVSAIVRFAKKHTKLTDLLTPDPLSSEGLYGRVLYMLVKTHYFDNVVDYAMGWDGDSPLHDFEWDDDCDINYYMAGSFFADKTAADAYEDMINSTYQSYGGLRSYMYFKVYMPDGNVITNEHEPISVIMWAPGLYDFENGFFYPISKTYFYDGKTAEQQQLECRIHCAQVVLYLDDLHRDGKGRSICRGRQRIERWLLEQGAALKPEPPNPFG